MKKMMNKSVNCARKIAADAMQSMLAAERIAVRGNKRNVIAADGMKLPFIMKGWYKRTWRQSEDGVIYKRCGKCHKWFPLSEYPILDKLHGSSRDGRAYCCPKCRSEKNIANAIEGKSFQVQLDENITISQRLAAYSDTELLRELRTRGYKGELTFSKVISV